MNKETPTNNNNIRAFKAEFDKRLSDFEVALRKVIGDEALYDAVLKVYAELSKGRGESLALLMAISHIWGQIVGNVYCELEPAIDPGHDAILIQMVTDSYGASLEKLIENRKDMTARQRAEMEEYVAALREHALAEKANRP